jgi:5-oxoprolinase (ATP-hydrolysing)
VPKVYSVVGLSICNIQEYNFGMPRVCLKMKNIKTIKTIKTNTCKSKWAFWIDCGGTFTDIVARKPDGEVISHKLLSENPERYPDAALEGIRHLLGVKTTDPIPAKLIETVKMGTTVATNALLERKGEATLLVTTRGFKDALRIGYQNRPRLFDKYIQLPEMLYSHVIEVDERITARGDVLLALDEAVVRQDLQTAFDTGLIKSIAIVFMHAYRFTDLRFPPGLPPDKICIAWRHYGGRCLSVSNSAPLC